MKKILLCGLIAAVALAIAPRRTDAAFTFTLSQVGNDVVITGSGTINFSALSLYVNGGGTTRIYPAGALLYSGSTGFTSFNGFNGGGLKGPANFGTGGLILPSSGTGSFVGIDGSDLVLLLPSGYTSGTSLTDTSTYLGQTFTTLGFTPGTYTYTWGSGANADSLTITGVLEPTTWALLGFGALVVGAMNLRRRRATS